MQPQTFVEERKKFEDYLFARNLTTVDDQENEYFIPSSDYVEKTCVFIKPEQSEDTTPQSVTLDSLCTVIIRSPGTEQYLDDLYLCYTKDKKKSGDNEINEDRLELQIKAKLVDKNKQPLLDDLYAVYKECSEVNWDGYGAQPISKKAYLEAGKLIRLLPSNIKEPEIVPEPTGEIAFEWYIGKRFIFVISVGGNNSIAYAGLFGSTSKTHGTEYFGTKLPSIIVDNIQRLFEKAK
ncbi:MAG: hypothetical protein V3S16_01715 [Candidatus Desulfatibia sp.]|uniref:hypothetical protein n=1 Tax=Candidatus Desulfatibia sp. TaxID=3101189 RepID=UPI002F345E92